MIGICEESVETKQWEDEVVVAVLEGSEGCKVEIFTVDGAGSLIIGVELVGTVCCSGIEGAQLGGGLGSQWIAWYMLPRCTKVAGFTMLGRRPAVLEMQFGSPGVVEA